MPIYLAELLENLIVKDIKGTDKVKGHLQNLGIIPGQDIVLVNKIDDNVILKVKGVSLAISRELAKRILV